MAVRILLADRDEADRLVLLQNLTEGGCQVATAADGAAALSLAVEQVFELAVVADDLDAPGFGAVVAALSQRSPATLLVAISGRPREALAGEHPQVRLAAAFRRPVDGATLLQQIERWFNGRPAELPALSLDKLREDLGGDDALVLELAQTFVMELMPRLDLLEAAWAAADRAEVRRVAHLIKGSAASFGAPALAAAAAVAEDVAVAGSADLAAPVDDVKRAGQNVIQAVAEYCAA